MTSIDESDGAPDEIEPGQLVVEEVERLAHHPRQEMGRLREVADAGESGATPFIELARVAIRLWPVALVMIAIVLAIYFYVR